MTSGMVGSWQRKVKWKLLLVLRDPRSGSMTSAWTWTCMSLSWVYTIYIKKVLHCKHVSVMQKINVLVLRQSGIRSTDAKLINFIAILIRSVIQCFNDFNFRAKI